MTTTLIPPIVAYFNEPRHRGLKSDSTTTLHRDDLPIAPSPSEVTTASP